jgi:metallo-beta-lactamase superfamily protein
MTGGQSAVRMNDRHSFPVGGLVELSRATYQSTPLAVVEIRPKVFSFIGAGGTVTAVGGSRECALIDTGYGPRVPEIRSAIARALHQSPRWLIDTHWHFDHTDGNSTFAEGQTTVVGHANCRARMSQDQYVPSLEWRLRSSPRSAWPVLTFHAAVSIDLGSQTLELIPQEPAHTIEVAGRQPLSLRLTFQGGCRCNGECSTCGLEVARTPQGVATLGGTK